MEYDIYISSKIKPDIKEVVDVANNHNLNIEIKEFVKNRALDSLDQTLPYYIKALENFNGKLSLHGAFAGLNPVSDNLKRRDKTIYRFNQSIYIAKTLGVKTIVFHSGFDMNKPHFFTDSKFIENFINKQAEFWPDYLKNLDNTDITIVLENTSETTPDILIKIVKKVNSDRLKLCIDTGHVNHKTAMSVCEWIIQEGKNLHYMHLHNNWKIFDDHNSLLKGTINFKEVFKTLQDNKLHPGLSLEIPDYAEAMESLDFTKECLKIS